MILVLLITGIFLILLTSDSTSRLKLFVEKRSNSHEVSQITIPNLIFILCSVLFLISIGFQNDDLATSIKNLFIVTFFSSIGFMIVFLLGLFLNVRLIFDLLAKYRILIFAIIYAAATIVSQHVFFGFEMLILLVCIAGAYYGIFFILLLHNKAMGFFLSVLLIISIVHFNQIIDIMVFYWLCLMIKYLGIYWKSDKISIVLFFPPFYFVVLDFLNHNV